MLSVGYEPEPVLDTDGDGLVDREDRCKDEPEDLDGYEDADGCPDELNPVRLVFRDPYGYPVDEIAVEARERGRRIPASGGAVIEELLTPGIWILEGYAAGFDRVEEDYVVEEEAFERIFVLNPNAPPTEGPGHAEGRSASRIASTLRSTRPRFGPTASTS